MLLGLLRPDRSHLAILGGRCRKPGDGLGRCSGAALSPPHGRREYALGLICSRNDAIGNVAVVLARRRVRDGHGMARCNRCRLYGDARLVGRMADHDASAWRTPVVQGANPTCFNYIVTSWPLTGIGNEDASADPPYFERAARLVVGVGVSRACGGAGNLCRVQCRFRRPHRG